MYLSPLFYVLFTIYIRIYIWFFRARILYRDTQNTSYWCPFYLQWPPPHLTSSDLFYFARIITQTTQVQIQHKSRYTMIHTTLNILYKCYSMTGVYLLSLKPLLYSCLQMLIYPIIHFFINKLIKIWTTLHIFPPKCELRQYGVFILSRVYFPTCCISLYTLAYTCAIRCSRFLSWLNQPCTIASLSVWISLFLRFLGFQ